MTHTILCYGDSNTFGTMPMTSLSDAGRYDHAHRWPSVMAAALGPRAEVIAEGLPGRTTLHDDPIEGAHRNGLSVLPAILESHRPLDLVIVMLGSNDLKHRFSVTAADIAASVGRLATTIRASGCGPGGAAPQVLLICPPPILEVGDLADMFSGGAARSLGLAQAFAQMTARLSLPMLDAGEHIHASPLDGIHFAPQSQITLGLAIAAKVQHLLTMG